MRVVSPGMDAASVASSLPGLCMLSSPEMDRFRAATKRLSAALQRIERTLESSSGANDALPVAEGRSWSLRQDSAQRRLRVDAGPQAAPTESSTRRLSIVSFPVDASDMTSMGPG